MFEELVDNNKEGVKDRKRKNEEESGKSSRSRSSGLLFNHFIFFPYTKHRFKQGEGDRV